VGIIVLIAMEDKERRKAQSQHQEQHASQGNAYYNMPYAAPNPLNPQAKFYGRCLMLDQGFDVHGFFV
jgi:hypothetical protein